MHGGMLLDAYFDPPDPYMTFLDLAGKVVAATQRPTKVVQDWDFTMHFEAENRHFLLMHFEGEIGIFMHFDGKNQHFAAF